MIQLHATDAFPNQVASPKHLTFYVGSPPREMQIFTGIAIPNWDSQAKLDFADVLIHFNVPAPGRFPDDWDYTATVSVASIMSDDIGFTFATDQCAATVDENTGELLLYVRIAVAGSPAVLNRFSYHVEILSKVPVQGAIMGTITRSKRFHQLAPSTRAASITSAGMAVRPAMTTMAPNGTARQVLTRMTAIIAGTGVPSH